MEVNQQRRAAGLKDKIPDIQKTLETVRFLKTRKVGYCILGTVGRADFEGQADAEPIQTTFELNDTLYAKAEVPPTDEVYLWLGVCQVSYGKGNLSLMDFRRTLCCHIRFQKQKNYSSPN
jgi:hypothetical protein